LLFLFEEAKDEAGTMARRLLEERDALWLFLEEEGVEPTNNFGERALRFGVFWRKHRNGTQTSGGHHFDGDYGRIVRTIINGATRRGAGLTADGKKGTN
jgi:hypothetical protein